MLTKHSSSDQPSKNPSSHKLNFPYLSHKGSEVHHQRDRTLDLTFLPFYADNQSATDCSSAGRFFKNPEFPKTTRAASHSYKMPRVQKPRESFLSNPEPKPVVSSDQSWEVNERIESYKIRIGNNPFPPSSPENIEFKANMWKSCSAEICAVIKTANLELNSSLSYLFKKIFSLFDDFKLMQKAQIHQNDEKFEELAARIRKLQKDLLKSQQVNAELIQFKRLDEEKIKKEVEDMFPSNDEEIKRLKEESINLRSKETRNVPEALEKLWTSMQVDDKIPEATEIDLEQFNSGQVYVNLQENYKFVISKTVKHVKNSAPKITWGAKDVQTEASWIDSKVHEDLQRNYEKLNLALQSCQMQLENFKEDSYSKSSAFEKFENEKQALKNENLQAKREVDLIHKEVLNLKADLDIKKGDLQRFKKQNDEKTAVILALEAKIEHLTEKMLDLSYEMEKNKRSRPPSSFLVKKSERQIVKEKEKEKEKDEEEHQVKKKVEESAKPAFNFKDDFEKMFNFGNKSKKNPEPESKDDKSLDGSKSKTSDRGLGASFDAKVSGNDVVKNLNSEVKKGESQDFSSDTLKVPSVEKKKVVDDKGFDFRKINRSDSLKANEKSSGNIKKSKEKISNLEELNEDDSPPPQVSKPEKKAPKKPEKPEIPKTEDKKPKKTASKPTQKLQAVKNQISVTRRLEDLKSSSNKTNPPNPVPTSTNAIIESQDSEYLDSEENSNNRISTSRYHESSVSINKNPVEQSKTEEIQSKTIEKFKEKEKFVVPKISNEIENRTNYEEIKNFEEKSNESIEKVNDSLDKSIHTEFDESENYEGIEENIEKLKKMGRIDEKFEETLKKSKVIPKIVVKTEPNILIGGEDKCCGNELTEYISIGIQVNMNKRDDSYLNEPTTYFLPYNPNNMYGLRGDVYYQGSSFQPQARIPDLSSSMVFTQPYKLN